MNQETSINSKMAYKPTSRVGPLLDMWPKKGNLSNITEITAFLLFDAAKQHRQPRDGLVLKLRKWLTSGRLYKHN